MAELPIPGSSLVSEPSSSPVGPPAGQHFPWSHLLKAEMRAESQPRKSLSLGMVLRLSECLGLEIKVFQNLPLEMYHSLPMTPMNNSNTTCCCRRERQQHSSSSHPLPAAQEGKTSWDVLGFTSQSKERPQEMLTGIPRMLHMWQQPQGGTTAEKTPRKLQRKARTAFDIPGSIDESKSSVQWLNNCGSVTCSTPGLPAGCCGALVLTQDYSS